MKIKWLRTKFGIIILISTTFILLCASFLFSEFASSSADMVLHTMDVKASAERLLRTVINAEAGQRGFIITRNERFLNLYNSSKEESLTQLGHVTFLVFDNPKQVECLNMLREVVAKKFDELNQTVVLVKNQKQSEASDVVSGERGKTLMDEIRKIVTDFLAEEDRLLNIRSIAADRDKRLTSVLLLLSIFTFIIFAITEFRKFYTQNKDLVASNEKLDALVNERTHALKLEKNRVIALLQDVTHRVGNNLAMVSALLGVQIRKSDNQAVKTALSDARTRIAAIAAGQRRLQLDLETDEVRAKPYLENLLSETQQMAEERGISLKYSIDDVPLPGRDAVSYIVLTNELATNSLKHGFPDGLSGEILVKLAIRSKKQKPFIELSVEDDGVGHSTENKNMAGLGHSIIQSLIKTMQATLETGCLWPEKTRKGYKSVIKIPIFESNVDNIVDA